MELEEKAEEALETLWISTEENKKTEVPLAEFAGAEKDSIKSLLEAGYVDLTENGIKLTDKGRPPARDVVRRHRLAERLLLDVLGTGEKQMHERACRFEHMLDRGLDESICTLLGHPKVCPHGKPIPPGKCCLEGQSSGKRVVASLSQMTPGQEGKVAYIHTGDPEQLQKLTAMGVLPGAQVTLLQDFPSFVFQAGRTQFAVDSEIAGSIYVRLIEKTPDEGGENPPHRKATTKLAGFLRLK